MQRIHTSELRPGMVTAEDIFNYDNQLIVPKNYELTDKTITRLIFYSVPSVRIQGDSIEEAPAAEPEGAAAEPADDRKDWPYSKLIQSSPEYKQFRQDFDQSVDDFKNSINDIVQKGAPIDTDALLHQATDLFHGASSHGDFLRLMNNMRQYDDLTFAHSMNVALICNVLAGWLNLNENEIEMATLCGLLHDIGKLAIPDQIIKKPSKLTDEEYKIVKKHPVEGYNILKTQNIDDHIKNSALMHHEKCDGSGYPLGLKGAAIDPYAKIVAIADVYDAMTAARVYRGPLCPFKVIAIFEKEGLQKYDTRFILTFLENVVLTYMSDRVKLSDGREGDIVFINKAQFSKPMVNCNGVFVDLSKEPDLAIEEII